MHRLCINNSVPYWGSNLEQFLYYRVAQKNVKCDIFWNPHYNTTICKNNTSAIIESLKETLIFAFQQN